MIKNVESGARGIPGFESQCCHLQWGMGGTCPDLMDLFPCLPAGARHGYWGGRRFYEQIGQNAIWVSGRNRSSINLRWRVDSKFCVSALLFHPHPPRARVLLADLLPSHTQEEHYPPAWSAPYMEVTSLTEWLGWLMLGPIEMNETWFRTGNCSSLWTKCFWKY